MKRPGIHARLLFTAFVVISVAAAALGYMGVHMFHEFARNRFEDRFEFLARYLALNSELGILIDQPAMLNRLAQNLLSERDVARVVIYNADGKKLAEAGQEIAGPFSEVSEYVQMKSGNEESQAFHWAFPSSMVSDEDDVIGRVRLTYTTSQINSLLEAITKRFILLAAAMAAIGLVIFFLIFRVLSWAGSDLKGKGNLLLTSGAVFPKRVVSTRRGSFGRREGFPCGPLRKKR